MATVFHAWPYCRFIEILSNLRRKKLLKRNQGSNFLEGNFSNSNNVRALIQPRKEVNTSIIKDDFSSKTDPSIFASLEPLLSHQSSKTSWVFPALKSTSHFLPYATVSKIRFNFRCQLQLLSQIICLITVGVERRTISIDGNINWRLSIQNHLKPSITAKEEITPNILPEIP